MLVISFTIHLSIYVFIFAYEQINHYVYTIIYYVYLFNIEFLIFTQHEEFVYAYPWPNDVSILKLKEPIEMLDEDVKVGFACLPRTRFDDFTNDECWMIGWGRTNGRLIPVHLTP